jgi:hypothetical protein
MDLKQKLREVFTATTTLKKARVAKVKSLGDRVLVYLVSPTFSGKTPLQRQRLVSKAMQGAGILSREDVRRVGLVRTLTPATYSRILKARKARLNGNSKSKKGS